jgi:RHS repeat-associated protein
MRYEVADHLGNVHVTLTDHKNARVTDDNEVGSFLADLTMQADYQPFGSLLPGRYAQLQEAGSWIIAIPDLLQPGEEISITLDGSPVDIGGYNAYTTVQEYLEHVVSKLGNYGITASIVNGLVVIPNWPSNATWTTTSPDIATFTHGTGDGYRFGFQGQEKDDEVHGATGTSLAFEYRMHDPRVGRFLSIDPLTAKYPYNSPYAFSENKVIEFIELEGLETAQTRANMQGQQGTDWDIAPQGAWGANANTNWQGNINGKPFTIFNCTGCSAGNDNGRRTDMDRTALVYQFAPQQPPPGPLPPGNPGAPVGAQAGNGVPQPANNPNQPALQVPNANNNQPPPPQLGQPVMPGMRPNFNGNATTFANPAQANGQIQPLVNWMNNNPNANITLLGSVGFDTPAQVPILGGSAAAWAQPDPSVPGQPLSTLGLGRAETVRQTMIGMGIAPGRLWIGLGSVAGSPRGRVVTPILRP